ncbi:hypothetical protein [Aestuariivivens sediminicola]|uniref:hypothetical protein n=1 Tax=Aestuariivivens sediminicola TaxID=2913560 RepID=UPI001F59EB74|nr:hypothetical protein [Aestuariivivens sediminicola]
MKTIIVHVKVLIINLILVFIFSCEPPTIDGQFTGGLDLPCYDEWNLHYYALGDENKCEGNMMTVKIRQPEKARLLKILNSTSDSCIQVNFQFYWLGMKFEHEGYIKNSSSTISPYKRCN